MKNKHLVVLFVLTLAVGLAIRRAPWKNSTFFQTNLLKIDSSAVTQIKILIPDHTLMTYLRGDATWSAEQDERSVNVPAKEVQKMLGMLSALRSIRIVKTSRPDTLGFTPARTIRLSIVHDKDHIETLEIGLEIMVEGQPATYVQLPRHEGIYLVNNHLRSVFSKTLKDYRSQTIARFTPSDVRNFTISLQDQEALYFQKNDSTSLWESQAFDQTCYDEKVQIWLSKIAGLQHLAFSDLFDESHASEYFYATIKLQFVAQPEPLTLTVFRLRPLNVPEELPAKKPDRRQFAPFVLHSSQNPTNYFAMADTALLGEICRPF